MPPHVTVGTPPGHLPFYDVVSVVSIADSMDESESGGADGSGDELESNIESEGPYNWLGLSKNRYWQGNVSISREADEGMFLSACHNIWEILNIVTEPPSFKDIDIQTSTEVHNPMALTWIKATVRNYVAQQ